MTAPSPVLVDIDVTSNASVQLTEIADALETLGQLTIDVGIDMVDGFDGIERAITDLGVVARDGFDQLLTSSQDAVQGITDLDDRMVTMTDTLSNVGTSITDAITKMRELGTTAESTNESFSSFYDSIGGLPGQFVAWGIFNKATEALRGFATDAIGGNEKLEQFRATLVSVTGSGSGADNLLNWALKFGQHLPDTTQHLEEALVKIETLGLDATQVLPPLANIAATMGVDMPTAAQAFANAFHGRFQMLSHDLNINKEDLIKYGLQIGAHGKVIESTLLPALEKLQQARFPHGLINAMQTFAGQATNLHDLMQLLAMAFGHPAFEGFKQIMLGIIKFINDNYDALTRLMQVLGGGLAKVLQDVVRPLGAFVTALMHSHVLMSAFAGLLGGTVIGVLISTAIVVWKVIDSVVLAAAPFMALGAIIGVLVLAVKSAYERGGEFRVMVDGLMQSVGKLFAALAPLAHIAFEALKEKATQAWHALQNFLQSPMVANFILKVREGVDWLTQEIQKLTKEVQNGKGLKDLGGIFKFIADHVGWLIALLPGLGGGLGGVFAILGAGKGAGAAKIFWDIAHAIGGLLPSLPSLRSLFGGLTGVIGNVAMVFGNLGTYLPIVGRWFLSIAKFNLGSIFGSISSGFVTFVAHIIGFTNGIGPAFAGLMGGLKFIFGNFGMVIKVVGTAFSGGFGSIITWITSTVLPALSSGLAGIGASFSALIAPILPFIAIAAAIALVITSVVVAFKHFWDTSAGFRAMIGQIGKEFGDLVNTLKAQFIPIWHQLQDTFKNQLLPAWKSLQQAFDAARPLFILIGGIIIGVLVVAVGILIGVLKGLFSALGPVISGLIQALGGAIQFIAGVIQFVANLIGGIIAVIKDLVTGNMGQLQKDVLHYGKGMMDGLKNIFEGGWNLIVGVFKGVFGGIIAFIGGFVSGVWNWFTHLFEKLVGHSIITDGVKLIGQVFLQGITGWLKNISGFVQGALGFFARMVPGLAQHTDQMRRNTELHTLDMKQQSLTHIAQMHIEAAKSFDLMRQKLVQEIQNTSDPVKKHMLEMRLQSVEHAEKMHVDAAKAATAQRAEVVDQMRQLKEQSVQHHNDMKSQIINIVGSLPGKMGDIGKNIIDSLGNALQNGIGALKNIAQNIGNGILNSFKDIFGIHSPSAVFHGFGQNLMQGLANGIESLDVSDRMSTHLNKVLDTTAAKLKSMPTTQLGLAVNAGATGAATNAATNALGAQALANAVGAGGGNSHVEQHIHVHIDSDAAFGFNMMDPTSRYRLAQQIAQELGKAVDTQHNYQNAYSGYSG